MSERDNFKAAGDETNYRMKRNQCSRMIKDAKTEYYKTLIDNNKGDGRKLWSYLRDLAPKAAKTAPHNKQDGDAIISDPGDIANCLNEFFTSVVTKYIPSDVPEYENRKLSDYVSTKLDYSTKFTIPLISEEFVLKQLHNMDPKKLLALIISAVKSSKYQLKS